MPVHSGTVSIEVVPKKWNQSITGKQRAQAGLLVTDEELTITVIFWRRNLARERM